MCEIRTALKPLSVLLVLGLVTTGCGNAGAENAPASVQPVESMESQSDALENQPVEDGGMEDGNQEFPEYELHSAKNRCKDVDALEVEPIVSGAPITFSYRCGPFEFRVNKTETKDDEADNLFVGQGYVRSDVSLSWESLDYQLVPDEYNTASSMRFIATPRDEKKTGELAIVANQVGYVTWNAAQLPGNSDASESGSVDGIRTALESSLLRQAPDEDAGDWYICGDNIICIADTSDAKEGSTGVHGYVCRYVSETVDSGMRAYVIDLFGTGDFTKDDVLRFARGVQIENGSVDIDEDYVPEHVFTAEEIEKLKKLKEQHDREMEEAKERLGQYEEKSVE